MADRARSPRRRPRPRRASARAGPGGHRSRRQHPAAVVALLLAGAGGRLPAVGDPRMQVEVTREVAAEGADRRATPTDVRDPPEGLCRGRRTGASDTDLLPGTVEGRGCEVVVSAALAGRYPRPPFRRYYPFVVANGLILFAVGLAATVQTWRSRDPDPPYNVQPVQTAGHQEARTHASTTLTSP